MHLRLLMRRSALPFKCCLLALSVATPCVWPLWGCTTAPGDVVVVAVPQPQGQMMAILDEASGTDGHMPKPVRLVIRDEAAAYQARLPFEQVDFRTQMVLLVSLGRTPPGYQVRIVSVHRSDEQIEALVELIKPTGATLTNSSKESANAPWHAVVVERSDLPVKGFGLNVRQAIQRGFNPFR